MRLGTLLQEWFTISEPVETWGYLFEAACLVWRLSDREGVEIHNFDSCVIQKAWRTKKGYLSLFSDKYRCR